MQDYFFKNLISLYYSYKNQFRINYYNILRTRDSWSREDIKNLQWVKLKILLNHCYKNIPYYKKLFDEHNLHPNDINSLEDYKKVPVLTKSLLRDNLDEILDPSIPKNEIHLDSTSGSTGLPTTFGRSKSDTEYGYALKYRANAWCGWKYWDKSVWFVSDVRHITQLNKFKGRFWLWMGRRFIIDTRKVSKSEMYKWAKQIKKFKPKRVYGYSSLLAEFAEFALENNIKFKGIQGVHSTAEVLRKRETISKAFGAPVYDQYGCSEMPCIAHECKNGNMHINIDEVLVEFEDINPDSEIKKIVCTPLYIHSGPLLRYELGDCASPVEKGCDCGLPYPVMEIKAGRIGDNLVSPVGKLVSGITFGWYLTGATKKIEQFQLIQEDMYNFTMKIVSKPEYKSYNEHQLTNLLQEILETDKIKVKFEYPERIEPGKNGKYRPTVSKVLEKNQNLPVNEIPEETLQAG